MWIPYRGGHSHEKGLRHDQLHLVVLAVQISWTLLFDWHEYILELGVCHILRGLNFNVDQYWHVVRVDNWVIATSPLTLSLVHRAERDCVIQIRNLYHCEKLSQNLKNRLYILLLTLHKIIQVFQEVVLNAFNGPLERVRKVSILTLEGDIEIVWVKLHSEWLYLSTQLGPVDAFIVYLEPLADTHVHFVKDEVALVRSLYYPYYLYYLLCFHCTILCQHNCNRAAWSQR